MSTSLRLMLLAASNTTSDMHDGRYALLRLLLVAYVVLVLLAQATA